MLLWSLILETRLVFANFLEYGSYKYKNVCSVKDTQLNKIYKVILKLPWDFPIGPLEI